MSSKAQDASTQKQASAGATAQDTALAKNAAANQKFADTTRQQLFGTGGKGGTMGGFLDPSSLNQSGLSGTYQNMYSNAANKLANTTQNAVGNTMQNLANRGMGHSPAGFAADQQRKAYQDMAGQQGDLYTGAAQGQHGEALSNFWNANNMLNSNASQTANLSLQGNQAAAGNYANLYGTASQQVANPWAVAGQTLAGLGSTAGSIYGAGKKP
jgi:hypothetical protein